MESLTFGSRDVWHLTPPRLSASGRLSHENENAVSYNKGKEGKNGITTALNNKNSILGYPLA